jgi:cell division septation protein DedD
MLGVVGTIIGSARGAAQTAAPGVDSALQRAEQMVDAGRAAGGRALVDSLLASLPSGTEDYAEVLYVRASLAPTALDAERDYRRLTVEYSLSPRSSDALLRLAQLELARGDRAEARTHLARLTHDRPPEATAPRANLSVARAYIELGDQPHACQAIAAARTTVAPGDVELRNQLEYAGRPCPAVVVATPPPPRAPSATSTSTVVTTSPDPATTAVDTGTSPSGKSEPAPVAAAFAPSPTQQPSSQQPSSGAPDAPTALSPQAPAVSASTPTTPPPVTAPPSSPVAAKVVATPSVGTTRGTSNVVTTTVPTRPPPRTAPATAPSTTPPAARRAVAGVAASRGGFTVQVAAYNKQSQADDLAARLKARGYDVRVWGVAAPFRVRVGRYPTRAEATKEAAALAAKQITGWVVEAEPAS